MLWRGVVYSYMNGTDDYQLLDGEVRAKFERVVRSGIFFTRMEDLKRRALSRGVPLSDQFLNELCWCRVVIGQTLPEEDRKRLGEYERELYPLLVRLDPDAAAETREQFPDELAEFREEGSITGRLLTTAVCKELFDILTGQNLTSAGQKDESIRTKNPDGAGYIYKWKAVRDLVDKKSLKMK